MAEAKTIGQMLETPAKFLAQGGHAQQDIPAQHRLLNAGVMYGGWWAMDQLRQICFGLKMKTEGEYVEIKKEDVPLPLQFLHKSIEWDPHSEDPKQQWKKLLYQFMPGVGAGLGGITGSIYAFQRNGREQINKNLKLKGLDKLNMMDMDYVAQFAQSTPLRVLAAFFGTFSAASGLTFFYGMFLNSAFASSNGAKIYAGSLAKGNFGPEKAIGLQLEGVGSYVKDALEHGKLRDDWAKQFTTKVLEPMFGHKLDSPEAQEKVVKAIQGMVEDSYRKFKSNGRPAKDIADAVTTDLIKKLGTLNLLEAKVGKQAFKKLGLKEDGIEKALKSIGLNPKDANVGNANPIFRQMQKFLSYVGLSPDYQVGMKAPKGNGMLIPTLGAAAVGVGLAAASGGAYGGGGKAKAATLNASVTPSVSAAADGAAGEAENATTPPAAGNEANTKLDRHPHADATGKTPGEYAYACMELNNKQYASKQPPAFMKWMGEGQLAVLPKNRISCAIGLTAGLMIAGNIAKIATGYGLDKKAVDMSKVPTYLQKMKGVVGHYDPHNMLNPRNRWIYYGQWAAYSLGGLVGIKIGTDVAYSNVPKKNADPHYIEDYLPRVSMHQGSNWGWLSAFAGIFGSSSGLFTIPVPGINYGIGLAGRTTSMQDRNIMIGGLNDMISGAKTTSFLRLREGIHYMCHYAVGNPAENPAQIEYLAYTLLAPVFKDKLTIDHIQQFTNAVHEVRDRFWEQGGIPKAKRGDALKAMREVFTGAGLEVLLIDMGLNPGTIQFSELNGMVGKIGNIGISNTIQAEQNAFQNALLSRLPTYIKEGLITESQSEWVKKGIEAAKHGDHEPELPKEIADQAKQPKFADRVTKHSTEDLISKAAQAGDWRELARLSKAHNAPAAAVE